MPDDDLLILRPGPGGGPQILRDLAPADAVRRARQAAARQSVDLRLARTGSAAPPHAAQGRATQHEQCKALVRAYAPQWSERTLDQQARALWKAFMRGRREGWIPAGLPLAAWAAQTLPQGGA